MSNVASNPAPSADVTPIPDGRYAGGNHEVAIELRVDTAGCGVISADVYRVTSTARHYVVSLRTRPAAKALATAGEWPIVGQDEAGRTATGRLSLAVQAQPADSLNGFIEFEGALEGLPSRRAIPFVAERSSALFRTLGLEIEVEAGVEQPRAFDFNGRAITVESALFDAGFETFTTGVRDHVPANDAGWQLAQLHTLMSDLAQASLRQRAWELHLLMLSRSDRAGLLGVMFDSADDLQRQGCAIFATEIRGIVGLDPDRKLIQTTVHELGHALNLAHRFERGVGRADSTSFMNYDWRYRGGNRRDEFWNRFAFTFDNDELEFLRHAPLPPLIPGGAAFHSIAYWADGNGGYSPYVPEVPLSGWALELKPPPENGLFTFAQPVMLELALTNNTGSTIVVPKFMLDPKAGFVEIVIRRVHAGALGAGGQALSFVPSMQRCFEWDSAETLQLADGATMSDNVNLTFGSAGFAFAEPGTYDITALLVVFDKPNNRELIAKSATRRIRIAVPKTNDEEIDAMDFFANDVGLYLSLGGSQALGRARTTLQNIVGRRKKSDPLAMHATRALAIDASREYVRYQNGQFTKQAPKLQEAVKLIDGIDTGPKQKAFDAATCAATAKLAARWKRQLSGHDVEDGPVGPRVTRRRPKK